MACLFGMAGMKEGFPHADSTTEAGGVGPVSVDSDTRFRTPFFSTLGDLGRRGPVALSVCLLCEHLHSSVFYKCHKS